MTRVRTFPPEELERRRQRSRRHYVANRERILAEMATPEARAHRNDLRRISYATDPTVREKARAQTDAYRLANPDRVAIYAARYFATPQGKAAKRAGLLRRYNLTPDQYDAMLAAQSGVCAICRQPETHRHRGTGTVVALSIDHDHRCCPGVTSCGACIRGLLCDRCNVCRFPDDPAILRAAADYFERYTTGA